MVFDSLTTFKLAGIVLSGALGIIATCTETRETVRIPGKTPEAATHNTKRFTPWGKCALILTIAGLLTAIAAQLKEVSDDQVAERKKQAEMKTQLDTAKASLDSITRLLSRFKGISLQAVFEVDSKEVNLSSLSTQADRYAERIATDRISPTTNVTVLIDRNGSNDWNSITINLEDLTQPELLQSMPALKDLRFFVDAIQIPRLAIGVNYSNSTPSQLSLEMLDTVTRPNLYFHTDATRPSGRLHFFHGSRRLFLEWAGMTSTRAKWNSDMRIQSIHDLSEAQIGLLLTSGRSEPLVNSIFQSIRPYWMTIDFDNYPISLIHFTNGNSFFSGTVFAARLPNDQKILSGQAFINLPEPF
jgi:hypothetical protein